MTLTKLEIRKLFSEYDVTMDLSGRCCILVGANGVGKSTALKILDDLYNSNYRSLTRYPFESLKLTTDSDELIIIKRADFFPSKKDVKSTVKKYITHEYSRDEHDRQYVDLAYDNCCTLLDTLDRAGLLLDFYANSFLNLPNNEIISKIISSIETGQVYYQYTLEYAATMLKNMVAKYCEEYVDENFLERRFIQNDTDESDRFKETTFFGNMVQAFTLNSKKVDEPEYVSATLKWMSLKPEDIYEWKKVNLRLYGNVLAPTIFGQLMGSITNHRDKAAKEILSSIDDFEVVDNLQERINAGDKGIAEHSDFFFVHMLETERLVEINKLINRNYYSKGFVIDFNKRALKQYLNCISTDAIPTYYKGYRGGLSAEEMAELKQFYLDEEVIENIIHYFNPLLVHGSPLRIDIKSLQSLISDDMDPLSCQFAFYKQHWEFYQFYKKEIEGLLCSTNRSNKIDLIQDLFKGYSQIKGIKITPRGISLEAIHTRKRKHKHLELIDYHADEVDLKLLSSGEVKILLLLALAIFIEDVVILLDEPELSLSIIWQEKLLPDLLENTKLKKIVVATHSPYIAADDSLLPYITYLPS